MHCGVCLYSEHEVNAIVLSCFAIDNDWFVCGYCVANLVRCSRVHELVRRSWIGSIIVDSALDKLGEVVSDGYHGVTSVDGVYINALVCFIVYLDRSLSLSHSS